MLVIDSTLRLSTVEAGLVLLRAWLVHYAASTLIASHHFRCTNGYNLPALRTLVLYRDLEVFLLHVDDRMAAQLVLPVLVQLVFVLHLLAREDESEVFDGQVVLALVVQVREVQVLDSFHFHVVHHAQRDGLLLLALCVAQLHRKVRRVVGEARVFPDPYVVERPPALHAAVVRAIAVVLLPVKHQLAPVVPHPSRLLEVLVDECRHVVERVHLHFRV
mmetsp:Transcript_10534/g.20350  ORF Transcript_10534/g.20350 Transcript_10534/m.20350 type:complete len:218 (+) Transcript_10534:31-684(+)